MKHRNLQTVSLVIFAIGLAMGLVFNILSVWADFEASIFDASLSAGDGFPRFRCPIMIGIDETGVITGNAMNPLDRKMSLTIRSHSTDGAVTLLNETHDNITLEPGEVQGMEWTVSPDDAVWGNFILFRVYQFGSYPVPAKTSACGILVANVPLVSGSFVVSFLVITSLVGMGLGILLWVRSHQPLKAQPRDAAVALTALAVITAAGIIFNFLGMWLAGVLIVPLSIIMLIVVMAYFASTTRRIIS